MSKYIITYIAGGRVGISLQSNANNVGVYQSNNTIYDNRIVGCLRNFEFLNNVTGWTNNKISNNYSFIYDNESVHANAYSPKGVNWEINYFNSNLIAGNAAIDAKINEVSIAEENTFNFLEAGNVGIELFRFSDEEVAVEDQISTGKVKNVSIGEI